MNEEQRARLAWSVIAEPGDASLGERIGKEGAWPTLAALCEGESDLRRADAYRRRMLARFTAATPAETLRSNASSASFVLEVLSQQVLNELDACGARPVFPEESEWSTQLDDLGSSRPLVLFVRGANLRLAAVRSVAIVGARAASEYGIAVASELAADLADRGWVVVSGGAFGIDAAAHRGCLASGGTTVAVLACGIDVAYPRANDALLRRIADEGVVVSERPPGSPPTRSLFLTRNRLIAALTRGTVVVEAAHRSGSLNTAAHARQLGRQVLAVPGPITSPMSAGVHHLLREHLETTRLVTGADEVAEELGPIGQFAPLPPPSIRPWDGLDSTTSAVFDALSVTTGAGVAELAVDSGVGEAEVAASLRRLLLLDLATEDQGCWRAVAHRA